MTEPVPGTEPSGTPEGAQGGRFRVINGADEQPVAAAITAASLRIDPNAETSTTQPLLTKIPVLDRPDSQWYIRVRPGAAWRMDNLGLIKFTRDRRLYSIAPQFSEALRAYYRRHYAFVGTTITRAIFLLVIPMPTEDGSWNAWPQSKYACALAAQDRWLQVHNDGSQFSPHVLTDPKPDPDWDAWLHPCSNLDQVLELAFRSMHVNKWEHPVIEALLHGG
jgi:hypothetical protein